MHANISLLKHQSAMLETIAKIILNAFTFSKKKLIEKHLSSEVKDISVHPDILNAYHQWFEKSEKYSDTIAPHLFPLWTYPKLFKLGRSLNLPLHKVLNQGCKLIINSKLDRSVPFSSKIDIYDIKNMEQKYRINQRLTTGPNSNPEAIVAEIYAVILKNPKKYLKAKKASQKIDVSKLRHIESLPITKDDAKSYAYTSGDVNPIHLNKNIAKLMGLKGSIMHGFGLFALLFESIESHHFEIKEIDIRFLKPVYLGCQVHVYIRELKECKYQVRILSDDHMSVHLSGEFKV
mgnify:CR=1 FL=1